MTTRDDRGRRGPRWTLGRVVAPPVVVAALLAGTLTTSQSDAPQTTPGMPDAVAAFAAAAVPLPGACRPNPNPPPTEYGFIARVTRGTVTGSGPLKVTDIDVSICGVIRVVNAQPGSGCDGVQARLIIPAAGVVTNKLRAGLSIDGMPAMENVPTDVTATPMTSNVSCSDSADGLKMDLNLKVNGSAGIFGLKCRVPITGTVKATVTGPLLTPPYEGTTTIKGTVAVGKVSNNDKFCPGRLPKRLDEVVGLPASGYQVNWPTKVAIYHPDTP